MSELTTGGINFGYESPVNIIMGQVEQEIKQIQNETENTIMAEIWQQLGVNVDKEELIKALQYDRNQYDKGYSDGRASIVEELENQKTGYCKDCDRWNKGKRENNKDWCSDEGFCNNWRVITGEDFYCADFEVKENKE